MSSLWKMTRTQITSRKLKAGSRCAGHNPGHWHCHSVALLTPSRRWAGGFRSTRRVGVTVTSLSGGLTFHPLGPQWGTGVTGSGRRVRWLTASGRARVPGTVRDYGQGLGIRGQLLDWPGQGPVPGPWCITESPHRGGGWRPPRRARGWIAPQSGGWTMILHWQGTQPRLMDSKLNFQDKSYS